MTDTNQGGSQWLKDNLRIILSILIVVLIAGGIYSYSKRTEAPTMTGTQEEQKIAEEGTEATDTSATVEDGATDTGEDSKDGQAEKTETAENKPETSSVGSSQETGQSFIETAGKGDSRTTLARKALANYLEKNTDSSLTAEHKIYIEDYLRKKAVFKNGVYVGTSVEFSKNLIQEAIASSKKLNDRQLKNLHKYSVRVPSLS